MILQVSTCWLSVDQVLTFGKYGISASNCRVDHYCTMFCSKYILERNLLVFQESFEYAKICQFSKEHSSFKLYFMSTSDTELESLDTMVYDADHAITRRSTFVDYSIIILSSFVAKTYISCAYYIVQFRQQVLTKCWPKLSQCKIWGLSFQTPYQEMLYDS